MKKTDKSIHGVCVAAIKRSTMKPYDFKWTRFYESNSEFPYIGFKLNLQENELIICSTFIDSQNYSVLTSRRLVTCEKGVETEGNIEGSKNKGYGMFKSEKDPFTFGRIMTENGTELKYFIETGFASMIMIHGVKTLLRTQELTPRNIENLTRVWNRKNKES